MVTFGLFKRAVRAADCCGLFCRGDKLLPLSTVVYATSKLRSLALSNRRRTWLSGFYLRCFFQIQFDYPGWVKWIFAHVPFTMRIYRAFLMIKVGHCIYAVPVPVDWKASQTDLNYRIFARADSRRQRLAREVSSGTEPTDPESGLTMFLGRH